nr:MAG TPA: hypothetical protein [Caudoviricetes sp.]
MLFLSIKVQASRTIYPKHSPVKLLTGFCFS